MFATRRVELQIHFRESAKVDIQRKCALDRQVALAQEIKGTHIAGDPEFISALQVLREEFSSIDSAGAIKYSRFMADDSPSRDRLARRAVGAISALLAEFSTTELVSKPP